MYSYNSRFKTPNPNRGQHSNNAGFYEHYQPRQNYYGQPIVPNPTLQQHIHGNVTYSRPPQRDRPTSTRNQNHNQRHHEKVHHEKVNHFSQEDFKIYTCPGCSHQYEFHGRNSRHAGRIPLVLNCQHTVCQECISNGIVSNNAVCPVCQKTSALPNRQFIDNLQELYVPNFYILGTIVWSRSHGNNIKQISLVPTQLTLKNRTLSSSEQADPPEGSVGEKCCFLSCHKRAVLRCQDCNDVYCDDCCTVVHKSAKSLWSHVQVQITNGSFSVELEKCSEHGEMDIEFYCNTCDTGACCYCFIDKHEGHKKEYLSKLDGDELIEFHTCKERAEQVLRQLIVSQKKLKELTSGGTSAVEKQINNYFANFHGQLYFTEKKLLQELSKLQGNKEPDNNFTYISSCLDNSIKSLKNILSATENINAKKINLKGILQKLRSVESTPCYLLNESTSSSSSLAEFCPDPMLENLDDLFSIKKSVSSNIQLLSKDELPPDYIEDSNDSLYESDVNTTVTSILHSSKKEETNQYNRRISTQSQSSSKTSGQRRRRVDKKFITDSEMVEVTHIESLECFYVQLKKQQCMYVQMTKEIENYIKMVASPVNTPQINELYLALYLTKSSKMWCRGRVTDIKSQELEPVYEVYFIDFGSTQILDKTKLREITPHLAQKKPFAIQCELYNPTHTNWHKNAHVYMGKIINGKQLHMVVKNVNNGIYLVDLMVSSSDRGLTSIIDILINTCTNALSSSSDSLNSVQRKISYNPEIKVFSNSYKFQKNQTEKIVLANIIDPHHIFIHIAAYVDLLKTMMSEMKHYYKHKTCESFIPVEGSFVVVEHKDPFRGNLHRAFIKQVDPLEGKVHVLLIDWGLSIIVPWSNVKMLTENFTKLESQAILIKLAHVEPALGTAWSDRATLFLQKNFKTQEPLKMVVYNEDPLEVVLFETLDSVNYCINAQLVQEKLAESTGKISQTVEWPEGESEQIGFMEEEGFVASLLKKVDESHDEDSQEEQDEAERYVKQQIDIVRVDSPDEIYIKFLHLEQEEQNLHKELQIHYNKDKVTKETWQEDEGCIVQLSDCFTRGKIMHQVEDKYKVNLYDKATELIIPKDKLFVYSGYFKKFPKFVYKCHLANIRPAGGDNWSLSSIEALERTFEKFKDIFATKIPGNPEKKSIPMLMWYTQVKVGGALEPSITKFICINQLLVKLGFAYKSKSLSVSSAQDQIGEGNTTDSEVLDVPKTKVTTSAMIHAVDKLNESVESGQSDSDLVEKSSAATLSKGNATSGSSDWNDLIEEEQKASSSKQDSPYHTRETEITDWKPAFPIKKQEFNAWITCVETGGIIYLRDEDLQQVYKEMEANLKEYFENNQPPIVEKLDWQPGQICTISYKDYWYRGKVLQVNSPTEIVAHMIDFGSDHNLSPKQLYREILYPEIPAFASKVKLDRIYSRTGDWLSSDYDALLDVVTEFAKVIIKGSLNVELPLAEVYNDKGYSLNDILVKVCPNLTRYMTKEEDNCDEDLALIEEEDTLLPAKMLVNQIDTTSMKFKIESLPEEGFTDKVAMHLVGVLTYNKVVLKKIDENYSNLVSLNTDIQNSYAAQPDLGDIKVGLPCISPYAEDGLWYRALVHNIEGIDCGYVFVFFVDFGNVESVAIDNIKMMKPDWFDLPVSCYIADINIELKTDNHLEHVLQHMKKLYGKTKFVHFVSEDPLVVDLHEENGDLCYQSLINNGLLKVKLS